MVYVSIINVYCICLMSWLNPVMLKNHTLVRFKSMSINDAFSKVQIFAIIIAETESVSSLLSCSLSLVK